MPTCGATQSWHHTSYVLYYVVRVGTITFRADTETEQALATLTADGRSASSAIREALLLAAKARQAEELREEALALAADPDDVAEARAVLAGLEPLRAR